jgi:hypothetical protein
MKGRSSDKDLMLMVRNFEMCKIKKSTLVEFRVVFAGFMVLGTYPEIGCLY